MTRTWRCWKAAFTAAHLARGTIVYRVPRHVIRAALEGALDRLRAMHLECCGLDGEVLLRVSGQVEVVELTEGGATVRLEME